MMSEKQDKIPGYYTKAEYDAVYYRANRLQELYDEVLGEKQGLEVACRKLTEEQSFKRLELEDGEIIISDPKLRSDLAFILHTKGKPRIAIKYRGSTAYEIQPKD
jgi:hypothetical protein